MRQGCGVLEQLVQDLVVAGRRHIEPLLDRLFLDPCVLPPGTLEVEDVDVSLIQAIVKFVVIGHANRLVAEAAPAVDLRTGLSRGRVRA
jgi:hypothetical protein